MLFFSPPCSVNAALNSSPGSFSTGYAHTVAARRIQKVFCRVGVRITTTLYGYRQQVHLGARTRVRASAVDDVVQLRVCQWPIASCRTKNPESVSIMFNTSHTYTLRVCTQGAVTKLTKPSMGGLIVLQSRWVEEETLVIKSDCGDANVRLHPAWYQRQRSARVIFSSPAQRGAYNGNRESIYSRS